MCMWWRSESSEKRGEETQEDVEVVAQCYEAAENSEEGHGDSLFAERLLRTLYVVDFV